MNITNKILIGSVSALCIVGTLTLLKALFNDGGRMLTDWISAFSNALMAGAAVYAAMNAKDWIQQRKDEDAYSIAKDLIFSDLDKLSGIVSDIHSHNINLSVYTQHIGYDLNLFISEDDCNKVIDVVMKGGREFISINKLSRLGWNFKSLTSNSFEKVRQSYLEFHTVHRDFWTEIKVHKLKSIANLESPEYIKSKLSALDDLYQEFSECCKSFQTLHNNFDYYFDQSSTKK